VLQDTEDEAKKRIVGGEKFERDYWMMRLLNAEYLEQVYNYVCSGQHI